MKTNIAKNNLTTTKSTRSLLRDKTHQDSNFDGSKKIKQEEQKHEDMQLRHSDSRKILIAIISGTITIALALFTGAYTLYSNEINRKFTAKLEYLTKMETLLEKREEMIGDLNSAMIKVRTVRTVTREIYCTNPTSFREKLQLKEERTRAAFNLVNIRYKILSNFSQTSTKPAMDFNMISDDPNPCSINSPSDEIAKNLERESNALLQKELDEQKQSVAKLREKLL